MVSDKFRHSEVKHPEPKQHELLEKGQDVLKQAKKEISFTHHTIKNGETLSEICQQYGIPLKALYAVNQHELDPKIIEKVDKEGKKTIAYGAPTYHVGDKLNIPSQADVPNAVKYFEEWTKSIVAKQQLEKPATTTTLGKPPGAVAEQQHSRTQILDDEHLAARNAALMARVAMETKYNQHQTQRESQGVVENFVDLFNTIAKTATTGAQADSRIQDQRKLVNLMMKAAGDANLTQFKNLYRTCTGKEYNQRDFLQKTKAPTSLALEDHGAEYRKTLTDGNRLTQLGTAGILVAGTFIPGAAPVTLPLLGRLALGTAVGAIGAGTVDYMNKGETKNLHRSMTDGAIVGVATAASIPIAAGTEGLILAGGTHAATKFGATALARGAGAAALRVGAGTIGGGLGGGSAAGLMEGGLTGAEDTRKGKFDFGHAWQKGGEGFVTGALIGAPIGATGPLLKSVINIPKAAAPEATAAAATETAPVVSADAAVSTKDIAQAFNKTAELQPQIPSKGTTQPTDLSKGTQPTDISKGTVSSPPTDVSKDLAQAFNKTAELQPQIPSRGPTQQPTDLSKGAQPTDVSKGTVSSPPADAGKTTTSTLDVAKGTTPQTDAKTIPGDWSKQVPPLEKKTGDFPTSKIDSPETTKTFPKPPTDAKPTPTQSTGDASKTSSGDWNKGSTLDVTPQQKQAKPAEVTKSISPEEAWQKKMDKLAKDPLVKDLKPLELKDGWQGVEYQRKIGGRTVQESYNPKDGSKVFTEEYKDGAGVPHREVTTTSANGQEVTNKFRIRQGADGKQELIPVSNKWESHLAELRRDRSISNLEEIPMGNNWNKVRYDKANGRQVEEAVRNTDGARYLKEEFIDHRGVPNREVSTTTADGHTTTNRFKLDQNGQWKHLGKTRAGEAPEANSAETASMPPSGAQKWAKETIEAGNKWALDKLKSLGSDTHIANVKEVNLKQGWKAVEYTDAAGAKITEAYNPTTGAKHTIKSYTEKAVRYQEDTLEVPKDNYKLWQKQKQVETSRSRMRRQDDDSIAPEYEWETVDSTHHHNAKEQAAKLKTPTE